MDEQELINKIDTILMKVEPEENGISDSQVEDVKKILLLMKENILDKDNMKDLSNYISAINYWRTDYWLGTSSKYATDVMNITYEYQKYEKRQMKKRSNFRSEKKK